MTIRLHLILAAMLAMFAEGCGRHQDALSTAEVQFATQSVRQNVVSPNKELATIAKTPRNCPDLCDPAHPNYLCLTAGTLGSDRDQELDAFSKLLMAPQPVDVSHAQLLSVFKLQNAGYDDARGNTILSGNSLRNSGKWSTISATTIAGLAISIFVPADVQYSYTAQPAGFRLVETTVGSSFSIAFDDAVLQQTYGGRVLAIQFAPAFIVLTTASGCVAYNPKPQLASGRVAQLFETITERRLRAERASGASPQRLQFVRKAYARVSLFTNDPCNPRQQGGCGGCADGQVHCITSYGITGSCVDYNFCVNSGGTPDCYSGN